jgi:hypothetical protein
MDQQERKRNIMVLTISSMPPIMLAIAWHDIPLKTPVCWSSKIEPKYVLIYVCLLPLASYFLLKYLPVLMPDPLLETPFLKNRKNYLAIITALAFGISILASGAIAYSANWTFA